MNEIRAMVDQPHRLRLTEASPVASSDECHPAGVASGITGPFHDPVEFPVSMVIQDRKGVSIMPSDRPKKGGELFPHWNGEVLSGICIIALGILHEDRHSLEVDIPLVDSGLIEPAAKVDQDLKANSGPLLLGSGIQEFHPGSVNISIIELWFLPGRANRDNLAAERVSVCEFPADSLLHEEAEELNFNPRGIVGGASFFSMLHVLLGMNMLQVTGVADLIGSQPAGEVRPEVKGSCFGSLVLVVRLDVGRHPRREFLPLGGSNEGLFCGGLGGLLEGPGGLFFVIVTKFQVFLGPLAGVQVPGTQIPKGTAAILVEMSHEMKSSLRFPMAQVFYRFLQCRGVLPNDFSTEKSILPLHHRARSLPF